MVLEHDQHVGPDHGIQRVPTVRVQDGVRLAAVRHEEEHEAAMNEELRALADHHRRCLWCRYLFGCRKSDRLLSAYHRSTRAGLPKVDK